MIFINNIDSQKFTLNGIAYYKNFLSHVSGDYLGIINHYDSSLVLVEFKKYSEFSVDGVVYQSASALQQALLPVLFTRSTLGGGSVISEDVLISLGEILRNGNEFTFPEDVAVWKINNIIVDNVLWTTTIDPASANNYRKDYVLGDFSGNLHHYIGDEDSQVALPPNKPAGMVLIKEFNVFGDVIDDSTLPITGAAFVTKSSLGETNINTAVNNVILPENGKSVYNIVATGNQIIIGKNKFYFADATSETLPLGMELKVINSTGSNLSFPNNDTDPNIKPVITPDGETFIAEPGSTVSFLERENSILICSYSKNGNGVSQTYIDNQDEANLTAAKAYADNKDLTLSNNIVLRELSSNKSGVIDNSEQKFPNNKAVKTYVDSTVARKHSFVFYNTANLTADGKRFFLSQLSTGVTPYSSLSLLFSEGALDMANPANLAINDDKILGMYVPFKCKVTDITVRASKNEASAYGLNFQAMFSEAYGTGYLREIICNDTITSAISGPGSSSSDLTKTLAILPHSVIPAYSAIKFSVGSNNGLAQNINRYFRTIITVTEVI